MSAEPEVQIVIVPDPKDVVFDGEGTPMLTFSPPIAGRQEGWVLHYLDSERTGVDEHYLGGDVEDIDWAEDAAKAWLVLVEDGRDAYWQILRRPQRVPSAPEEQQAAGQSANSGPGQTFSGSV